MLNVYVKDDFGFIMLLNVMISGDGIIIVSNCFDKLSLNFINILFLVYDNC